MKQQATTHHRGLGGARGRGISGGDDRRETGGAAPVHDQVGFQAEPSRRHGVGDTTAGEVEGGVFCLMPEGDYQGKWVLFFRMFDV